MEGAAFLGILVAVLLTSRGNDLMDAINPMLPSWNRYDARFKYHASQNGLPNDAWKWLKAIGIGESNLGDHPLVIAKTWSSDGLSRGLMQLVVPTANDYEKWFPADVVNKNKPAFSREAYDTVAGFIDDPEVSIRVAAKHFARLYRKFNGVLEHAVKAYNQGEGNMAKEIAYRAANGFPVADYKINSYPAAANYWERFKKHLAQVEAKP